MMPIVLSIVVPCYNEEENIPLILNRFSQIIGERSIEVIVVNNGSTDGSALVLDALIPNYTFARQVLVPVNKGYGFGIISGLKEAKGKFIGWTHADMQTDPADVAKAYDLIKEQDHEMIYVKGKRKKRPASDSVFTVGMSFYETLYLKKPLWDINAQPNIFSKRFFEELNFFPDDFSLDLYMYYMALQHNQKVIRFDVLFTERLHGTSKWNDNTWQAKKKFIKRTFSFSKILKRQLKNS